LTIALDIKNKKTIEEALDLYIKGDLLEGDNKYQCELYNRKIKAMKRCCIKRLSNTVVVQLKRFELDYNSMLKKKVNDYCEFPFDINFKPWSKAGLQRERAGSASASDVPMQRESSVLSPDAFSHCQPRDSANKGQEDDIVLDDDYYQYELVGVVVHSGTAEAGHYTSLIKERDPNVPTNKINK
jgi:ubiquitin C-terminal hydrolase